MISRTGTREEHLVHHWSLVVWRPCSRLKDEFGVPPVFLEDRHERQDLSNQRSLSFKLLGTCQRFSSPTLKSHGAGDADPLLQDMASRLRDLLHHLVKGEAVFCDRESERADMCESD